MWIDIIVEETRKIREEQAAKHNYNIYEIFKELKEKENQSSFIF